MACNGRAHTVGEVKAGRQDGKIANLIDLPDRLGFVAAMPP